MTEEQMDAVVAYMNEVNKLMNWCERVRPPLNTPRLWRMGRRARCHPP